MLLVGIDEIISNPAKMRIVSLLAPARNGVYQFHCNLSRGLAQHGCSITWLCSGSSQAQLIGTGDAEPSEGEVVAPDTDNLAVRTRALVARIKELSPNVLLCHAVADRIDFNAIRYMPDSIPKVLVPHGSSLALYRAAQVARDYVNATVAISQRIRQDLISAYGFHEDRLELIRHGVDTSHYANRTLSGSLTGRLRILSHGRIEKNKGVFGLPEMLAEVGQHSDDWDCTISGDGPGLVELKQRIARAGLSDRVQFTGWTASEDVPELMSQHQVFLFPSQWEGYPIALVEAMVGGCAPIASRLPGVTDWIIQDGVNGLLFPIGNVRRAARHLLDLLSDRHRLAELRQRARESVSRYDLNWMAGQYYQLFHAVQSGERQHRRSESLDECDLAKGLKPAWWYGLPEPIKERLRIAREMLRTSISVS